MGMNARTLISPLAIAAAACAALPPQHDDAHAAITLTPDRPDYPRSVRFDVPTALIMGIPGERIPTTLQARISTRELAAHELASAGYCPNGFTGPEGVFFPGGDRSRAAFIVRCVE
jgi:hypothetical protein